MPARKKFIILVSALCASAVILAAGAFVLEKQTRPAPQAAAEIIPVAETVDTFPYDHDLFNEVISKNYADRMATSGPVVAGLVPHHDLAGSLAAEFFSSLAQKQKVKNFIIIGPLHSDQSLAPIISGHFIWDAGFARVENNYAILDELVKSGLVVYNDPAVKTEHSLYNMVPFIAHYFPEAKIVPIALTSHNSPEQCFALATALQKYLKQGDTVVVASIDFSHYLPSDQTPAKNARMIELINDRDYQTISGLKNDYLDSPPSLITLLQAADLSGARVNILQSTNSGEITGTPYLSSTSYVSAFFAAPLLSKEGSLGGSATGVPGDNSTSAFLPTAANNPLKLLFFGDIMLDRHVGEKIKAAGNLDWIFSALDRAGIFAGNDLVSANLEGAVTDNGAHYPPTLSIDFAFTPALVGQLAKYDFNYFNIANNHLADQGKNGIIETEKNLADLGFAFAGCADRQIGDCTSKIIQKNGRRIGLVGASMVYGSLDEKALLSQVKELASTTDLVVAQMHWGTEYQHAANKNQISLAHQLIDAGADLVIGTHPHVVEGIEIYKDKPIFYSLGNFVFDQYFSTDTQQELGVQITADGNDFKIDLLPIESEASQLRLMNDQEKNKFLSELAGWSIGSEDLKNEIRSGIIQVKSNK